MNGADAAMIVHRCPRCHAHLDSPTGADAACRHCGAVYLVIDGIPSITPHRSDEAVQAYFHRVAEQSEDSKLGYAPWKEPGLELQLRILSSAVTRALLRWVPAGSSLLDVGCGHGGLLERALPNYRMVGIDFVLESLQVARRRGYAVYHGDASALPFADGQFDAVVSTEVLNQYDDATGLLKELARVCRPGGSVIVSTLNRNSILRRARRFLMSGKTPAVVTVPVISRTARELIASAANLDVTLREIAWVISPSNMVFFTRGPSDGFDPLAANFILCMRKKMDSITSRL